MDILSTLPSPPPAYSACAFWFWNGELRAARMCWQMDEMKKKGVDHAFMHARAYLRTPYMGEQWFAVMDACVQHAAAIGFFPWLYDEYAWPSGTCGSVFTHGLQAESRVLQKGRQNMAKGLDVDVTAGPPAPGGRRLVAACPLDGGRTMAFYEQVYTKAVDYLNPAAIRDFLDCTHEIYQARYGADFGKTIPGIFFDEIYMAAPLPWTDALPAAFEARYGYDLLPLLPYLVQGGSARAQAVRRDYYALLATLYERAFFCQIADWCEAHHLRLTGHTEEELRHHPRRQGDYFQTMRHLHIPGADCHDYRYRFPREISVHEPKYAVSVARAYGKPRAMSEAFGGAGWGCSLQTYKRGVNALGAMGVNMFVLHGFYNECEHQGSQADWPASFFYQNPYWAHFRPFADYIRRVSYMNAAGRAVVDVGLYYPAAEIAAHTVAGEADGTAQETDRQFHRVLTLFLEMQMDVDYIDRDSILHAELEDGRLHAGAQRFRVLLCPDTAWMEAAFTGVLHALQAQGGLVLFYQAGAAAVPDGFTMDDVCSAEEAIARTAAHISPDFVVLEGSREQLYSNHREIDGQDAYMVASTSSTPRRLRLSLQGKGAMRRLSPETGQAVPLPFAQRGGRVEVDLALEADEACWLLLGCPEAAVPPAKSVCETLSIDGLWEFLPLDTPDAADAAQSVLSVPLAQFTDLETGLTRDIRIRNTAEEPGRCGRHISLWRASWLGRRVGWGDDANKPDLYFSKTLPVDAPVRSARLCLAAINEFTLYINGQPIARQASGGQPCTLDVTRHLHAGRNHIAVHVHTDTPLDSRELTQAETIPPGALASLLLQGEIETETGMTELISDASWAVASAPPPDWMHDAPTDVQTVDPRQVLCHGKPGLTDGDWVWAWERGRPPMQPWGDLPLFGRLPLYPRTILYSVALPAGTCAVQRPDVVGHYTASLDQQPVSFTEDWLPVPQDGRPHTLALTVTATSAEGGLRAPIRARLAPRLTALGDFGPQGLSWFSGHVRYQKTVELLKAPDLTYVLDLGDVHFTADVRVNGKPCGVRLWQPYRVEITQALQNGRNTICVTVANSAACERRHMLVDEGMALAWNRYWNEDNIDREPGSLQSGVFGPVRILVMSESR